MEKNLRIYKSKYAAGGVFLGIFDEKEGPYADITVCLPGYTNNEIIAIDHNLFDIPELANEAIELLTDHQVGEVLQGFTYFKLYKLKDGILDTIPEFE